MRWESGSLPKGNDTQSDFGSMKRYQRRDKVEKAREAHVEKETSVEVGQVQRWCVRAIEEGQKCLVKVKAN